MSFSQRDRDTTRREAGKREGLEQLEALTHFQRRMVELLLGERNFATTAITPPGAAFSLLLGPTPPALLGHPTAPAMAAEFLIHLNHCPGISAHPCRSSLLLPRVLLGHGDQLPYCDL